KGFCSPMQQMPVSEREKDKRQEAGEKEKRKKGLWGCHFDVQGTSLYTPPDSFFSTACKVDTVLPSAHGYSMFVTDRFTTEGCLMEELRGQSHVLHCNACGKVTGKLRPMGKPHRQPASGASLYCCFFQSHAHRRSADPGVTTFKLLAMVERERDISGQGEEIAAPQQLLPGLPPLVSTARRCSYKASTLLKMRRAVPKGQQDEARGVDLEIRGINRNWCVGGNAKGCSKELGGRGGSLICSTSLHHIYTVSCPLSVTLS
ncbi:hypothetical protein JOQ06_018855, partial [Pogonophryne albipinna]